ncbi:MAG: hypothetical protein ACRDDH_11750 [Cetobacterium sp.]|uniref:hypothetical protein n=1 Tax=Cetobacterium sp. TaxID=2071632 RepID=UPI003EE67D0B
MNNFTKWLIGMFSAIAAVVAFFIVVFGSLIVACSLLGGVTGFLTWIGLIFIGCIGSLWSDEVIDFADKVLDIIDNIYTFVNKKRRKK